MFAPYRRIGRMVTDQIEKFTDAKSAAIVSDASKSLEKLATEGKARPFDIGRSMGIFAAIGLALGAIGTALASIASALFSLSWWQFPLLLAGLFLAVSGPSMFLAWLKLRRRTLGPVLDASGWAVNSQIPINFMLGSYLTDTAALPPNANRTFNDPFRNRSHRRRLHRGRGHHGGLSGMGTFAASFRQSRRNRGPAASDHGFPRRADACGNKTLGYAIPTQSYAYGMNETRFRAISSL